jgi:murein L,D-transpeptidase YafK
MMFFLYNFLSIFLILGSVSTGFAQDTASLPSAQYPKQILNLSTDPRIQTNALLADKSKRKLTLIDQAGLATGHIKEQYTIDIGRKTGDKKKRDDRCTPEGMYILLQKKTAPEIPFETYGSMAFTTNYPNFFDKFENKTGSGIWLHSVPDKVPLTRGSSGCVVLRNNDIKKIEPSILLNKTFLIIDSQINWISAEEHAKEKQFALDWFENWRSEWEKQDLEHYIENYSDEFSAPPYTKKTWLEHKQMLKEKYAYVKVTASEPNIFEAKNQYIIQFVQNYESDGHKDTGIKTLHVLKEGDSLKIKREDWSELK